MTSRRGTVCRLLCAVGCALCAQSSDLSHVVWSADASAFRYDAHGRRDPFEPLMTSTGELRTPRSGGATGTLHVEGVLWDPAQPLAIVNGEVRRVGDEVEGFKIVEIRATAIVVNGADADHLVIPVVVEGTGSAP